MLTNKVHSFKKKNK